jgi:hypothetical protein
MTVAAVITLFMRFLIRIQARVLVDGGPLKLWLILANKPFLGLNTARMAWFSSDRTIREYAEDVWKVPVV